MIPTLRSWWQDRLLRGVIRSSGYLLSSNGITAVLTIVQGILATRLLGPGPYGLVAGIVIPFASNINRLLSFRMSEVVVKYLGQYLSEGDKEKAGAFVKGIAATETVTSLVAYLVLAALAPLAARFFAKDASSLPLFLYYGLFLVGFLIFETSTGVLQTTRRFDRLALINVLQTIVTAGLILWAFVSKGGVLAVLTAYLLGKILAGLLIAGFAFQEMNRTLGRGWWRVSVRLIRSWREIFGFALSTNFNGTVNLFARDSETLLIGLFRSQVEVGYFRNAQAVINLVMMPIDPFIGPTYAEISHTIHQKQYEITTRLLKRVSAIAAAWTLSVGGVMALFGWWVIPTIYGPKFAPSYPAFVLLLFGYGFANIFQWNRPLLLALGMPGYPLKVSAIVGVGKTLLSFALLPFFGYLGEAAVLSGFFIASISLVLRRGFREVRDRSVRLVQPSVVENQL